MKIMEFSIPYPLKISVNHCYGQSKGKIFLHPNARNYRHLIYVLLKDLEKPFEQLPVRVEIKMYPPDKRIRDIDGILKQVLDALQYAKVFKNDNQVYQLYVEKLAPIKDGRLDLKIYSLIDLITVNSDSDM